MSVAPWPGLKLSRLVRFGLVLSWILIVAPPVSSEHRIDCSNVLIGQSMCPTPEIDHSTQQLKDCTQNNTAYTICSLAPNLSCAPGTGLNTTHYIKELPCEWTNGYSFEISLLLSVFLGMFGIDRLYLGYPGLALAKFCTFGGMLLWQLIDIILIAMQVVRPSDGSQYVISYFGQRFMRLVSDNETYIVPQPDW